eukprot:4487201-Pyramimonas_sp.AAC.1
MAELMQAVNDLKNRLANASAEGGSDVQSGPIEPSRDKIEELLAKLREHERVVELDSTRGTRGSPSAGSSPSSPHGFELVGAGMEDSPNRNPLKVRIHELEMESRNPREAMLSALKAFDGAADLGR